MKPMVFRRRNYLIDKDFQLRYVAKVLFGIMVMALIIALTIYYATWSKIMDAFYYLPPIAAQFATLFTSVNQSLLLLLLIFIGLATIVSIFISHRIAGPLFRFERSFETIGDGDLSIQVHLRKNDEFHDLAKRFNQMISQLNERIKQEQQSVAEIDAVLEQYRNNSTQTGMDQEAFDQLGMLVKRLKQEQQEHFKL